MRSYCFLLGLSSEEAILQLREDFSLFYDSISYFAVLTAFIFTTKCLVGLFTLFASIIAFRSNQTLYVVLFASGGL